MFLLLLLLLLFVLTSVALCLLVRSLSSRPHPVALRKAFYFCFNEVIVVECLFAYQELVLGPHR